MLYVNVLQNVLQSRWAKLNDEMNLLLLIRCADMEKWVDYWVEMSMRLKQALVLDKLAFNSQEFTKAQKHNV